MEAVRAFNNELSGLYETKPPVSRAKMANVTKGAIKAIKFYKHVVQSVEKFIQKCKPEYKVPGLYVIDSVVRQSRHQFGAQRDVFAPRFTKNIITTFQNLFKCPGEERSKIVRVLNLWQKNDVFPSEIVQPLLDLAADPTKPSLIAAAQAAVDGVLAASGKSSSSSQQQQQQQHHHQQQHQAAPQGGETGDDSVNQAAAESMLATQNDMLNTVTQLLQQTNSGNTSLSAQQQSLQQLQLLQQQLIQQTALMQQPTGGAPLIDANLLAQIQALTNQLLQKTEAKPDDGGFNKKLLDFDYGESDDEEDRRPPQQNLTGDVQTILNDSGLMQQIHQVSQTIQKNNEYTSELTEQEKRRRVLEQQQAEFDHQIAQGVEQPPLPFGSQPPAPDAEYAEEGEYMEEVQDEDFREHQQFRDRDDRDRRDRRRRSRDKSRSRTPKRRRRSRSRDRDRRRRSRSRDRHRRSRSKDKDREKKERERDRRKKGLPLVRANFVTICTTTIWIGHLNKFTSEDELRTELERYGPVDNINMVPPRGCAYVVMSNRKDAYKAIDRLKGHKLNGSALKTAWAQSTGIRESEHKDSWDLDEGSMYLPWDSLPKDLTHFLDGAIIDGASLPENLKDIPTEKVKVEQSEQPATTTGQVSNSAGMANVPGQPQMPQLPGQPPMMGMMPGNMPPMPGMMPGMMMPMQRPVVPGMPPQPMSMTPGAPPQMMPGSQVPTMPGVRPPGAGVIPQMPAMSIPSTAAANSLAQTIQNIMSTTAGVIPSSPSVPPRPSGLLPGMSPGGPRFGFNPNMPPPGFRLPPPGFGSPMRPLIGGPPAGMPPVSKPSESNQLGDRLSLLAGQGTKQPEMAWPPDSNDKDDDMEEDDDINEDRSEIIQNNTSLAPGGQFGRASNMPPRGMDQSPMRMMGPPPPGGFPPGGPPGPPNQPWNMNQRMGGPRGMRPPMGGPNMGPMGNQDRFGGPMNQMMGGPGPRGPPFMGNMPGGPGFQRFGGPRGPGNIRGPVSLLDLDLKPKDTFVGESFNKDEEPIATEEMDETEDSNNQEENYNEPEQNEPEEDPSNCYPFNTWTTVNRNNNGNRNRDRSDGYDRSNRGRDRDRNNDDRDNERRDSRDRDRHRSRDHDRSRERDRSREKDRSRDRDRDRGDRDRGDRDRDWKRRDDLRDDRRDRDRDRDRGDRDRSRRSRWSDNDTEKRSAEEKTDNTVSDQVEGTLIGEEELTKMENSGNLPVNEPSENVAENLSNNAENSVVKQETTENKDSEERSEALNENVKEVKNESVDEITKSNEESIEQNESIQQKESVEQNESVEQKESVEKKENIEQNENVDQVENINASSQNNGPVSATETETVPESKVEPDKMIVENTENVKNDDMDLEEGEISS